MDNFLKLIDRLPIAYEAPTDELLSQYVLNCSNKNRCNNLVSDSFSHRIPRPDPHIQSQ